MNVSWRIYWSPSTRRTSAMKVESHLSIYSFCMYAKRFFLVKESFKTPFSNVLNFRICILLPKFNIQIQQYSQSHKLKCCDEMAVTRRYNCSSHDAIDIAEYQNNFIATAVLVCIRLTSYGFMSIQAIYNMTPPCVVSGIHSNDIHYEYHFRVYLIHPANL